MAARLPLTSEIYLWGRRVGAIYEDTSGIPVFEYFDDFRSSGWEISPLFLPLKTRGGISFKDLLRSEAFYGLPGVFADSLPDRFGNKVIDAYFKARGQEADSISLVQKLLYIGKKGMGALEYRPALNDEHPKVVELLEIARLVEAARKIVKGEIDEATAEIMRISASAGGARAKALIGWNQGTNDVISGLQELPLGYGHWIIKFDGTDDSEPKGYGRLEYAYSRMAREGGINMPETHLLEERNRAHFLIRRFDRDDGGAKTHMTSLGGLLHKDFNEPRKVSYGDFLTTTLAVTGSKGDVIEGFKRMVFNVVARNQDDHVKNLSFLMNTKGQWALSPAYDMTYARGRGVTKTHQMTVNGQADHFERSDLMAVANGAEIKAQVATAIIERITDVVSAWPRYAAEAGISKEVVEKVSAGHRLFARGLQSVAPAEGEHDFPSPALGKAVPTREAESPRSDTSRPIQSSGLCKKCQKHKLRTTRRRDYGTCFYCDPRYKGL